jgi:hypothetical protein
VPIVAGAASFAGGVFLWWFFEYVLHRFVFHGMKGVGIGSREHLEHHVTAGWNFDWLIVVVWVAVAITGLGWGSLFGWTSGSAVVGWALGLGWASGYYFYEFEHWRAHKRAPRNAWERWVRKNHFHHHFGHPLHNQGVTLPIWDFVFRTMDRPDVVGVPRRLAPAWLVDEDGELRPEYADDYVLLGSRTIDLRQSQIDRARAFANLTPTA